MLLNTTTANWVTIFGGALALMGIGLFQLDLNWAAIGVLTVSFLTDWFDGALGRYQQGDRSPLTREEESELSLWQQINYRGVTHLGRAIDPLVDKIRFIGLLWVLGVGFVPTWIICAMTGFAIALTCIRPLKRLLRLDDGGANRYGKLKVYMEVIAMVILVLTTRPLYKTENLLYDHTHVRWALWSTMSAALFLAGASLYGHIKSGLTYARTQTHGRKTN
ncbi:hypothetical protein CO174_02875 [Candidatus Uhrbacteria bacterium CG_4_9_14_3_um_filter_50_9]|uniref:CDP-alcohol phosphatidyltransferase family protein n=1 Tax=Candidatus Uhrbacteria bacterium CG_4_9_14_3_um_filter_50_9 TaxID=1975035 RepID=A0A2M7XCR5_9BACT|nr:MAG: hypothetical protein CO174_02875 [Candidatus Uhrbacteria bacterium CG_4_9_14_3_um_filter_50_9]